MSLWVNTNVSGLNAVHYFASLSGQQAKDNLRLLRVLDDTCTLATEHTLSLLLGVYCVV